MSIIYIMKCGHISNGTMFIGSNEIPVCIKCRLNPTKEIGKEYDYREIFYVYKVDKENWESEKKDKIEDEDSLYSANFIFGLLGLKKESIRHYPSRYKIGKKLSGWYFTVPEILILISKMKEKYKEKINFEELKKIVDNFINN